MSTTPIQFKEFPDIFTKKIDSSKSEEVQGASFGDILTNAIQQTNDTEAASSAGTEALLSGEVDDVAQLVIDGQKAELALQLTVGIRNKVVDAYNEIMRMQL